jgi:hypothetical protein
VSTVGNGELFRDIADEVLKYKDSSGTVNSLY